MALSEKQTNKQTNWSHCINFTRNSLKSVKVAYIYKETLSFHSEFSKSLTDFNNPQAYFTIVLKELWKIMRNGQFSWMYVSRNEDENIPVKLPLDLLTQLIYLSLLGNIPLVPFILSYDFCMLESQKPQDFLRPLDWHVPLHPFLQYSPRASWFISHSLAAGCPCPQSLVYRKWA